MHWAGSGSNDEHVQILLDFGASLHIQDARGNNPINRASTIGSLRSLERLLIVAASDKKDLNSLSKNEFSPPVTGLQTALSRPTSYLNFVLEQKNQLGQTSLCSACSRPNRTSFVKLLLEYTADINGSGKGCGVPILRAIPNNRHATIELLFKKQARLDLKDSDAMGILHVAAVCANFRTLMILKRYEEQIRKHCNIDDKDIYGNTPLQAFDITRRSYVTEDDETRSRCRKVFLSLLGLESQEPISMSETTIQEFEDPNVGSEISEELVGSSEEISIQETRDLETYSTPLEDDASDIFLDVEQDPEGPI